MTDKNTQEILRATESAFLCIELLFVTLLREMLKKNLLTAAEIVAMLDRAAADIETTPRAEEPAVQAAVITLGRLREVFARPRR